MKSNVRGAMARLVTNNLYRIIDNDDNSQKVIMSAFAEEMIYTVIPQEKVTVKNWSLRDGVWSTVATTKGGRRFTASGSSIKECLSNVMKEISNDES